MVNYVHNTRWPSYPSEIFPWGKLSSLHRFSIKFLPTHWTMFVRHHPPSPQVHVMDQTLRQSCSHPTTEVKLCHPERPDLYAKHFIHRQPGPDPVHLLLLHDDGDGLSPVVWCILGPDHLTEHTRTWLSLLARSLKLTTTPREFIMEIVQLSRPPVLVLVRVQRKFRSGSTCVQYTWNDRGGHNLEQGIAIMLCKQKK